MKSQVPDLTLVACKYDDNYLDFISLCVRSGITGVQLRDKKLKGAELLRLGQEIKELLTPFKIPLIVNDDVELCLKLDAEGVHLGQADGDIKVARKLLGPHKIIGLTVDTMDQLKLANELPVDYIGVGAIFATKNKPDVQTIWGLDGLKKVAENSIHPIIAIGGIDESNAKMVMQSGADGIAAIGVFYDSIHLVDTVKYLRQIIDMASKYD